MSFERKISCIFNIHRHHNYLFSYSSKTLKIFFIFLITLLSAIDIYPQDYSKTIELQKKMQAIMAEMMANQNDPEKMEELSKEFEKLAREMQAESQNVMKDINSYKESLHPVIQNLHELSNKVYIDYDPVTQADEINKGAKEMLDILMKIYSGETEVIFPPDGFVTKIRFCSETVATIEDKGAGADPDNVFNFRYHLKIPYKASWSASYSLDIVNRKGFFHGFELYTENQDDAAKKVQVLDVNGWKQVIRLNGTILKGPVDKYKVELGGGLTIGPSKLKQYDLYDVSQWPESTVKEYLLSYAMPAVLFYSSAGDQAEEIQPVVAPCYKSLGDVINFSPSELVANLESGTFTKTITLGTSDPNCISNTVTIEVPYSPAGCEGDQTAPKGAIALTGDCIDHGGFVLASDNNFFVNGKPVARVGDKVFCMIHGITEIVDNAPNNMTSGQKRIARKGDKTKCGAIIISGSPDTYAGNK